MGVGAPGALIVDCFLGSSGVGEEGIAGGIDEFDGVFEL